MNPRHNLRARDFWAMGIVALVTLVSSFIAYRPSQLYFFGDTWDILNEFREQGWQTIWRLHNEHFMPVSKVLLYAQYQIFGMNNYPYQVINLGIHSVNAALVYVLAGEFTDAVIPRVFGALVFSFSTVYWELTMWEAGQQTTLALLFILLSLALASRFLRGGDARLLAIVVITSALASWSMGFGLLMIPLLAARALLAVRMEWKRALALAVGPSLVTVLGYAVLLRTDLAGLQFAQSRASLSQGLHVIPWTSVGLRGLANSYLSPLCAPVVLCGFFAVAGLIYRRRFFTKRRAAALVTPLLLLVLPYVLTSFGRVQLGIELAASSRYHYLPAAALGLLAAWTAAGAFEIAPRAGFWLAMAIMITLPLDAIAGYEYARRHSPFFEWGRNGRRFAELMLNQHDAEQAPAGVACVRPELYLPASLYPRPVVDVERVLPLYGGAAAAVDACRLRVTSVLGRADVQPLNLLAAGQRSFEGAPSAYRAEVPCANTAKPYTFAASVKSDGGDPAWMRIRFKGAGGNDLESYLAPAIAAREFTAVVVSAFPSAETATVAVDFGGSPQSVISVKDAVLLEHPVYLPLLLQEEIADEHGVDARRVEAADGVARRAHQRLAEQIERSVVEHRQPGGFAGGVQQFPVQRILLAVRRCGRGPGRRPAIALAKRSRCAGRTRPTVAR